MAMERKPWTGNVRPVEDKKLERALSDFFSQLEEPDGGDDEPPKKAVMRPRLH